MPLGNERGLIEWRESTGNEGRRGNEEDRCAIARQAPDQGERFEGYGSEGQAAPPTRPTKIHYLKVGGIPNFPSSASGKNGM